jgi:hypothetical protein
MQRQIFNGMMEAFSKISHYKIDKTHPVSWLKLLKVLHSLPEIPLSQKSSSDLVENSLRFFFTAGFEKNEQPLGIFYSLRCIKQILPKIDANIIYIASEYFREVFSHTLKFLIVKADSQDKPDALTFEIMILSLEFLNHMLQFVVTHKAVKELGIVQRLIVLLKKNLN